MRLNHARSGCVLAALLLGTAGAHAELLTDPEFDQGGTFWGKFGAADFNDFFGGNPHASLFADGNGNFGGVFQLGITGTEGQTYRFDLTNVRIEANFNAAFRFGLEYYGADDTTKLGETMFVIDTNDPNDGLVTGDGLFFTMEGQAVAGTVYVRPIILFDNAAPVSSSQANAFVFAASLNAVPAPGMLGLGLAGLGMGARRRRA